jgi:hypothetical protein
MEISVCRLVPAELTTLEMLDELENRLLSLRSAMAQAGECRWSATAASSPRRGYSAERRPAGVRSEPRWNAHPFACVADL